MLRTMVFIVALTGALVGLGARLAGHPEATPATLWGGFITIAMLIERWRYNNAINADAPSAAPGDAWQPTTERFVDLESGRVLQVFYNPQTGARRYEHDTRG